MKQDLVTIYNYDSACGSVTEPCSVTDSAGVKTYFKYDENGRQYKSWEHFIDSHNTNNYCDVYTITEYDDSGRVIKTIRDVNNVHGNIVASTVTLSQTIYNSMGKVAASINELGLATEYDYDETGNVTETRTYDANDAILTVSRTLYDVEGRAAVTTNSHEPNDTNVSGTETVYDVLGRVIETRKYANVVIQTQDITNTESQVVGKRSTGWSHSGTTPISYSRTEYDKAGRVQMSVALDKNRYEQPTSYEYDKAGKQKAVIDPCGHTINYVYDANHNAYIVGSFNFDGTHKTITHYAGARRDYVTDANGQTTAFEYDALGRVTKTTYPPKNTGGANTYIYVGYDGFGRKAWESKQTTKALAQLTAEDKKEFEYDSSGRLSAVILPTINDVENGDTLTRPRYEYKYDAYGDMNEIWDKLKKNPQTGDVNPKEIKKMAEKYFGPIPGGTKPEPVETVEPLQLGERRVTIEDTAQPVLIIGYHKPSFNDSNNAVFQAISEIIGTGRTSRLYKTLVKEKKIAVTAGTSSVWSKYPYLFQFYIEPAKGHTPQECERTVYVEIERLKTEQVSDEELEKAKAQSRADLIKQLESNAGLAENLAFFEVIGGDWRNLFRDLDKINKVTAEDIQRVANQYFTTKNRTVGIIQTSSMGD